MSTKFFVKTNLVRHVVAHQQVVSCWWAQTLVSITFGRKQVMLCVSYGSQKRMARFLYDSCYNVKSYKINDS